MRWADTDRLRRRLAAWERERRTNWNGFAWFADEAIAAIREILNSRLPQKTP